MPKKNLLIIITVIVIAILVMLFLTGLGKQTMKQAVIKTNKGDIIIELFYDQVPKTVENFVKLSNNKTYNDVKFHRVIDNFMVQTGDPQTKGQAGKDFIYQADGSALPVAGTGGPGYTFEDEFHPDLKHDSAGTVSMANSGPNTNGSQFFFTHTATDWLDGKHTVFGKVIEGQDIVNAIVQGDVIEKIMIK